MQKCSLTAEDAEDAEKFAEFFGQDLQDEQDELLQAPSFSFACFTRSECNWGKTTMC